MSKWFGKGLDIKIDLEDAPPNLKYSSANNTVKGTVRIDFNEDIKKISHICCGLQGKAHLMYYASDLRYIGLQTTVVSRQIIHQDVDFFNVSTLIPLDCEGCNKDHTPKIENGIPVFMFNAGEHLECKFNFQFPPDIYLPSSAKGYGNIDAEVSIQYEVYVDVHKLGKILNKPKSYVYNFKPILFQSGADPRMPKNLYKHRYNKSELFKDKLKKFYFDDQTKALIPTSMNKSHSKTKFIRKLWDNNYKPENYAINTKTIPLSVDFQIHSPLDLTKPLLSQFTLKFISDLKEVGIFSNQTTDFVLNDQSTGLGHFQIDSLRIETRNQITLQHNQFIMRENTLETILKVRFKGLTVDIKDFEYNKEKGVFEQEIDEGELFKAACVNIDRSLMDLMGEETIMCAGMVDGWLQNLVEFNFVWKVTDGNSHSKRIEFQTSSMPDILYRGMPGLQQDRYAETGLPSFRESQSEAAPPPTYEMSKTDVPVENTAGGEDKKS